jgi:serine/threonine protein phosphatase PrpC
VLDGATDVTPLTPFKRAESGASWIAEALSSRLIHGPNEAESAQDYWAQVLGDVRVKAEKASAIPLDSLPLEASPIAAGVWLRTTGSEVELASLGDCVALMDDGSGRIQTIGSPDKPEDEAVWAKELLRLSEDERMEALRVHRRLQNTEGRWIFGLEPQAARHLEIHKLKLKPGSDILMMSDGLYRLISPYKSHTPETLFELIRAGGLLGAIRALRAQEVSSKDDAARGRIKTRDDACGLWLRFG